ncbi:alcohol dehydrogenase catalytic domain-containing protein [uncultured Sphaerochaeta sp.]|uniref:zinc-dependent alcohol dehydrogenase n=1 Tax=uncultured Sphaerochaeta sp. TaxID=886478 RepID=UPI002A0A8AFA|nr:zinc-binding dehydrogenase [uncultured Sphaerochaeta sp.]
METLPKKMKVVAVEEVGKVSVREVPMIQPLPGEIVIRIQHCLLCTWEQRIFNGMSKSSYPFIPGHEVSGHVAYIPEDTVTSFSVGDPVVMKTLDSCGHCEACYRGDDNLCTGKTKKRVYDGISGSGGLAQYICLPVARVYALPDPTMDLRFAAFAEPLACCINSIEQANITLSEDVVVVGAGIMGQLHIALAVKRGARVLVVEIDKERAELAKRMGASVVINPLEIDAKAEILRLTQNQGAHVVFITTTMASLAQEYLGVLKKRGRIVYYGSFHPDLDITINPNAIHYSEKIITGSYSPTSKAFWIASRLLSLGIIDVSPFLSGEYDIEDAQKAFEHSVRPGSFRVLINL